MLIPSRPMVRDIQPGDIRRAADRIEGHIRRTPMIDLGHLISDDWTLSLKLDQLQPTGSFKVRGAFNVLLASDVSGGVVAASGGNFGKAIAYAAERLGVRATVFVPETSPKEKTGQIAQYGADVKVIAGYYDDALESSHEFARENQLFVAHAFDQHEVVSGQGTVALETAEQFPEVTTMLVAVGGGGLIGGIASWFRSKATIVGVEPEMCPTLHEARSAGQPVEVEVGGVAASSLGSRKIGEHPWTANRWIDESVLVSDESIVDARQWLWDQCRLWVEPAAAAPMAALLTGAFKPVAGEKVVALVSGGNAAVETSGT